MVFFVSVMKGKGLSCIAQNNSVTLELEVFLPA